MLCSAGQVNLDSKSSLAETSWHRLPTASPRLGCLRRQLVHLTVRPVVLGQLRMETHLNVLAASELYQDTLMLLFQMLGPDWPRQNQSTSCPIDPSVINANTTGSLYCAAMTVIVDSPHAMLCFKMLEVLLVQVQDHRFELDLMVLEHLLTQREVDE